MDVVIAAQRRLASVPALTALLNSDATYPTWLWRWKRWRDVEGTGSCGMVLAVRNGWAGANAHNTARFPALQVEVLADVDRDADGLHLGRGAEEKALEVYDVLDFELHRTSHETEWWGAAAGERGVRVISSVRGGEPTVQDVPDGDGMVRLLVTYNLTLG